MNRLFRTCLIFISAMLVCVVAADLAVAQAVGGIGTIGRFGLQVDGNELYSASSCSINSENPPQIPSQYALLKVYTPGPTFIEVVCTGKMTNNFEIWAWQEAVRTGNAALYRKSASLVAYSGDDSGQPVARWHLTNAWPSSINTATVNQVMMETVTFTAQSIQRVLP